MVMMAEQTFVAQTPVRDNAGWGLGFRAGGVPGKQLDNRVVGWVCLQRGLKPTKTPRYQMFSALYASPSPGSLILKPHSRCVGKTLF